MHLASPDAGTEAKAPERQQFTEQEQRQLMSLMQNPAALSQLLALQQTFAHPASTATASENPVTVPSVSFSRCALATPQQLPTTAPALFGQFPTFPNSGSLNRPLPSPPQIDRSLLHSPLPYWTSISRQTNPANLLAAQVCAEQQSRSGLVMPPAPVADYSSGLFRSSSLGSRYLNSPLPAELSLRASSMPGAYQDITARLQLNRAGINTATTSMIPVMSQEWLVIPFGTAQQLLPGYAGDMLGESGGDAVMLVDERCQNWPMQCKYSR